MKAKYLKPGQKFTTVYGIPAVCNKKYDYDYPERRMCWKWYCDEWDISGIHKDEEITIGWPEEWIEPISERLQLMAEYEEQDK